MSFSFWLLGSTLAASSPAPNAMRPAASGFPCVRVTATLGAPVTASPTLTAADDTVPAADDTAPAPDAAVEATDERASLALPMTRSLRPVALDLTVSTRRRAALAGF